MKSISMAVLVLVLCACGGEHRGGDRIDEAGDTATPAATAAGSNQAGAASADATTPAGINTTATAPTAGQGTMAPTTDNVVGPPATTDAPRCESLVGQARTDCINEAPPAGATAPPQDPSR